MEQEIFSNLEDERLSKNFLNFESRKRGYNDICKLSINNQKLDNNKPIGQDNPENILTTDQNEIRKESGRLF